MTVPQMTPHACLASSVVDGIGDIFGWEPQRRYLHQRRLVGALGGLRFRGTTMQRAATVVRDIYPGLNVEHGRVPLGTLVGFAVQGAAVSIGLAPLDDRMQEGHAVRLEAGEGLLPGQYDDPFVASIMSRANEDLADAADFDVWLFDPCPGVGTIRSSILRLRNRHQAAGGEALVVTL